MIATDHRCSLCKQDVEMVDGIAVNPLIVNVITVSGAFTSARIVHAETCQMVKGR